jgi:hypothetical protein
MEFMTELFVLTLSVLAMTAASVSFLKRQNALNKKLFIVIKELKSVPTGTSRLDRGVSNGR